MKEKFKTNTALSVGISVALTLLLLPISPTTRAATAVQRRVKRDRPEVTVAKFEGRAKEYASLREQIEEKLPKLSKESTAEEIETHKKAFEDKVRVARAGAKRGQLFTPDVAAHFRAIIKAEYKGQERQELRETVLEADTKGVPLRVNYPYPEDKELVEMPPTLLLKLPQLPKQLRYRFVGRNLLLVDRENGLIVDYMLDALP
jgi:hypothetical protein